MKYRIGMLVVCMGSLLTGWANEVDEEVINAAVTQEVQETSLVLEKETEALTASIHHEMEFHALKHEMKILVEQIVGLKTKLQQVEEENKLYQSACSSLQSLVLRLGNMENQIIELQDIIRIQNASLSSDCPAAIDSSINTLENLMPGKVMQQPAVERKFHGAWRVFSSLFRSKIKG